MHRRTAPAGPVLRSMRQTTIGSADRVPPRVVAAHGSTPDGRPAQLVFGYFAEGFWRSENPQGFRRAGNWHRRLATYLNALLDGGFVIMRVLEPEPSPALPVPPTTTPSGSSTSAPTAGRPGGVVIVIAQRRTGSIPVPAP